MSDDEVGPMPAPVSVTGTLDGNNAVREFLEHEKRQREHTQVREF